MNQFEFEVKVYMFFVVMCMGLWQYLFPTFADFLDTIKQAEISDFYTPYNPLVSLAVYQINRIFKISPIRFTYSHKGQSLDCINDFHLKLLGCNVPVSQCFQPKNKSKLVAYHIKDKVSNKVSSHFNVTDAIKQLYDNNNNDLGCNSKFYYTFEPKCNVTTITSYSSFRDLMLHVANRTYQSKTKTFRDC
jgi:hypothetical protein